MALKVGIKQEVKRCRTRGKSDESIAYRQENMQARDHPGFKTQGRHYQKSKTGVKNRLMSSKNFKKKNSATPSMT